MPSEQSNTKTVAQVEQPETQRTNLELPIDVYEALRLASFEQRIPQKDIIAEALRKYLKIRGVA